jgi:shikimate 5-dehydrogenase
LFGSFSEKAGNVGCLIFNKCFQYYKLNAIYKSFSIDNLHDAIISAKCLGFSGFAVSMPFKNKILTYLDHMDDIVKKTNSCNTVLIKNGKLYGYNTDYFSIYEYLQQIEFTQNRFMYILGDGAYSKNVQNCCDELNIQYEIITRTTWGKINSIKKSIIFNCTPVENIEYNSSNHFINCINTSSTGKILALKQATLQFSLYTGLSFPTDIEI